MKHLRLVFIKGVSFFSIINSTHQPCVTHKINVQIVSWLKSSSCPDLKSYLWVNMHDLGSFMYLILWHLSGLVRRSLMSPGCRIANDRWRLINTQKHGRGYWGGDLHTTYNIDLWFVIWCYLWLNIIQIHNSVMGDWQYSTKYFSLSRLSVRNIMLNTVSPT